ncbi:MAG: hypothetical protein MK239_05245, partial [Gemmatimonadetes bacterium]|nr:hypothetical protein [Gemmatimonadota bacterium]
NTIAFLVVQEARQPIKTSDNAQRSSKHVRIHTTFQLSMDDPTYGSTVGFVGAVTSLRLWHLVPTQSV